MDETLTISTINATEDGGSYECVVINDAGFGVAIANLYVRPIIVEDPVDMEPSTGDNYHSELSSRELPLPRVSLGDDEP